MQIRNKNFRWLFIILGFAMLLFACSSDQRIKDLHRYIANLKKAIVKHHKKDLISTIRFPVPVVFQPVGKERDLFVEEAASYSGKAASNPLSSFPLRLFEYLGIITLGSKPWAIIKAPDNKIYQLTIGDQIGDHYGRIKAIYPNHIEVEEQQSGQEAEFSGQTGEKLIVNLQLKGGT